MACFLASVIRLPSNKYFQNFNSCRLTRCAADPPRDGKSAVRQMTDALQTALRSRLSRLDLEMPVGMNLGIEREVEGDIEMARVVANMFEGTGLNVRCLIGEGKVERLSKGWKGSKATIGKLEQVGRKEKTGGGAGGGGGFGKKSNKSGKKVDVYVVIAPRRKEMKQVANMCERFGMDVLIILVNARLDDVGWPNEDVKDIVTEEFERVYVYKKDPHPQWAGGVLFRKYPEDWILVRKNVIGSANKLLRSPSCPSLDDIANAFREEAEKPSNKLLQKMSDLFQKKV